MKTIHEKNEILVNKIKRHTHENMIEWKICVLDNSYYCDVGDLRLRIISNLLTISDKGGIAHEICCNTIKNLFDHLNHKFKTSNHVLDYLINLLT